MRKLTLFHTRSSHFCTIMNSKQQWQTDIATVYNRLSEVRDTPCISILMNTHSAAPEQANDHLPVKAAFEQALILAEKKFPGQSELLTGKMNTLLKEMDFDQAQQAIGIYLSPSVAEVVKYPFAVREKVKVDNRFDTRDLLYYSQTLEPYYVLSVAAGKISFFEGRGPELHEIHHNGFPVVFHETREYAKPVTGTSFSPNRVKEYEPDESQRRALNLEELIRKADHSLHVYMHNSARLLIAGGTKEVSAFIKITAHGKHIMAKVVGSFHDQRLAKECWLKVNEYTSYQNENLVTAYHELIGRKSVAVGLAEVWQAANEDKGLELLVEKDYEQAAYISADSIKLSLRKDAGSHHIPDPVSDIISTVIKKGGRVRFTGNGVLKDFDGIALQLRYPEI